MHPAAVGCHASTPVTPTFWYEGCVAILSGLLEAQAGVATHSFASVLDQLAAARCSTGKLSHGCCCPSIPRPLGLQCGMHAWSST